MKSIDEKYGSENSGRDGHGPPTFADIARHSHSQDPPRIPTPHPSSLPDTTTLEAPPLGPARPIPIPSQNVLPSPFTRMRRELADSLGRKSPGAQLASPKSHEQKTPRSESPMMFHLLHQCM